jgi:hypothetical protein
MNKLKLKNWVDEHVETMGSTEFSKQLGISRAGIRSMQLMENDTIRHVSLQAIAAFKSITLKEVKEWLEISSIPTKPIDNSVERITKLEESIELLQAEMLELKNLNKLLVKEINALKKSKTGKSDL